MRLFAALLLTLCPSLAMASEDVRPFLEEGARASREKRWDACATAYGEALRVTDSPSARGELGLCEERLGKHASAFSNLHAALAAGPSPVAGQPWTKYQQALVRLADRVSLVSVTASPPEARILVDGRPLGRADGRQIPLDPGQHTFSAKLSGYEDLTRTERFTAGALPNVHLAMAKLPASLPILPALVLPAPKAASVPMSVGSTSWFVPSPSSGGVMAGFGWGFFGVAVVGVGTMAALEVDRLSVRRTLSDSACAPSVEVRPVVCDVLVERRNQRDVAMGVAIGSAVFTGISFGAAWLLHDRSVSVSVVVHPESLSGSLGGSF